MARNAGMHKKGLEDEDGQKVNLDVRNVRFNFFQKSALII